MIKIMKSVGRVIILGLLVHDEFVVDEVETV